MSSSAGDERQSGYWYDGGVGQKERARQVLEALRTYRAAEAAMRRRTRNSMEMGENELLTIRFLLRRPGHSATPSELVTYLGATPASVTAMLDRLVRTGRLERMDGDGARGITVRATDHVNDEVRDTLGQMHVRMYGVATSLTPSQQKHVIDFLDAMVDAVDKVEPV